MNESKILREKDFVGFADVYLKQCVGESKSGDKIDKELYAQLVELDERLGTTATEQLYRCLTITTRSDIIKV